MTPLVAWGRRQAVEEGENSMSTRSQRTDLREEHKHLFSLVLVVILVVEAHQLALGRLGRLVELEDR